MVRGLILVVLVVGLWGMWAASGSGVAISKSRLYPGGEVGWYFACTYLAALRTFEVNYSEGGLYREDEATFFDKQRDCPMFAHESEVSSRLAARVRERGMSTADTGSIIRIAELEIDPEHIERYRELLAEEIAASVANEPGVLFLHAVAISGSPHLVRILEGYADQAAYDAHLQTPHFLKYKMKTSGMIVSLQLLPVDPIALHGKGAVRLP